ncbi:MAG: cache domain-containing protein [Brevinematales bacterium]|nr:cache domain-containing protein [Brevinematales bacterium]
MLKNLRLRTKITIIFVFINIVIIGLIAGINYTILSNVFKSKQDKELSEQTYDIIKFIQAALSFEVKNKLKDSMETDLKKINEQISRFENKKLSKNDLIDDLKDFLLNKKIGESGYYYILDINDYPEKAIAIVHPKLEGQNLAGDTNIDRLVKKQNGYIEYDWKNPGDKSYRKKVAYLHFNKKLNWLIGISAYKEDFISLVGKDEIRYIIEDKLESDHGNSFVMDYDGNMIFHPTSEGKNLSHLPHIQKMIMEKEGNIIYVQTTEGKGKGQKKKAFFKEIPEFGWVVVSTILLREYNKNLAPIQNFTILIAVVSALVIWLVGRYTIRFLMKNLDNIKGKIYNIVSGTEKADLTKRLEITNYDEIGEIASLVNSMFEKLNRDILKVKITSDLLTSSTDETSKIMEENVRQNIKNIEKTIKDVRGFIENSASGIEELTATVEEMARNIDSIANSMLRQASAVEESASSIEEMVRNIDNTASLSTKTKDISVNLNNVSLEGSKAVKESISSIKEVSEYSQQILKLLGLISNIAKQTNLLAMNAAIEAAHAGEAGKGFAIVADEIRRLSEDTNKNARDIGDVVSSIVSKIDESVKLAEKAGVGLDMITAYSKQNVDIISQLNIAMQEQSNGAKEILKATQELVKITEEVKVAMTEQKHATDDFSKALIELRDISINMVGSVQNHSESLTSLSMAIEKIRTSIELNRKQAEELKNVVENFILKEDTEVKSIRLVE